MGGRHEHYEESRPPWERSPVPVPYLTSGSTGLTEAEREALPSLWATREQEEAGRRKGSRDVYVRDFQEDSRRPMYSDEQDAWRVKTPLTAPPHSGPPPPLPYGSPKIPQGPKSAPVMPSYVKQGTVSPPYSPPLGSGKSWSTTRSSTSRPGLYDGPRESRTSVTAMPGTMSARERSPSRRRVQRSASVDPTSPVDRKPDGPSFGKRLKLAFRDMFKKDPVDEANLERIEDRHWTEDEY